MTRILAADDDEAMRSFYMELFSDSGFEVSTAMDTHAAFDKYLEVHPDLLILDLDMPGGGGEKVFNLIHRVLRLGKPVIFVTGPPEKALSLAKGQKNTRVFGKPVIGSELLAAAREMTGD